MGQVKPFFGGLPTGPDVKRIMDQVDAGSKRGEIVKHDEVEKIIKVSRDENRYKTVTNAWRRKVLSESGVKIVGDRPDVVGVGFAVLTNKEQIAEAERQYGKGRRRVRDGWKTVSLTGEDGLDEASLKRREHAIQTGVRLFGVHREAQRSLAESTRPKELPPKSGPLKEERRQKEKVQ